MFEVEESNVVPGATLIDRLRRTKSRKTCVIEANSVKSRHVVLTTQPSKGEIDNFG